MSVAAYPEFFNDVFGPVMQPGSSSHMAGPCRVGRLAADLLGESPASVRVILDAHGSFAGTFGVMAEDRAMVAGALGMLPDDERLFRSFELAAEAGVEVAFQFIELTESRHPNAMKLELRSRDGRIVELVGDSTGGGMVETVLLDGFPLRAIGDSFLLLAYDPTGQSDEAPVAELLPGLPAPAGDAVLVRAEGRGSMRAVPLGAEPDLAALRAHLQAVAPSVRLALLRPVVPVLARTDRRPQLFDTMSRWREIAAERQLRLWEVALHYEIDASGWSAKAVIERMRELARLMRRQTNAAYDDGVAVPSGPFKPDFTAPWAHHAASPHRLTGELTARTIKLAYGAGAGIPGVKTVPGPMGSGGGYVFAALDAVREARGLDEDALLHGLFVAAGVGAIAFSRTEPTGEVLGCTGEAGTCGAMAAAGIVELVGGPAGAAENAASLALQALTGMPCDPIPGGKCQPCRSRVLTAACMAHVFADLALAGHDAVLPLHEALDVADAVGRALPPELKCTSEGGACAAPTARDCRAAYAAWLDETPAEDRPPASLI